LKKKKKKKRRGLGTVWEELEKKNSATWTHF